jgi:hypothetical protein
MTESTMPRQTGGVRSLAPRLAEIPGVLAVTLGGSRATGTHRPDSDWDFGLYYRGTIDADDVRALGFEGQVFAPGEWGRLVNGGAWLEVEGQRVDVIYRDLDEVLSWTSEAEQGRFEIQREVGYVAGIATYVLAGELALNEVLVGHLPRPSFPARLRETAPPLWFRLATGALAVGRTHADRGDSIAAMANFTQAVLAVAQGRLATKGEWALNEKRIIERAGLAEAQAMLADVELQGATESLDSLLGLPGWR